MSNRQDEIRKRIAKRKRERQFHHSKHIINSYFPSDEEKHGLSSIPPMNLNDQEEIHPLFKKEIFFLKVLLSACLILIVAILFKNQASQFDSSRHLVENVMKKEFQFATVSTWYEDKFGKPLALIPEKNNSNKVDTQQYAAPASGRVFESFSINGKGVVIETEMKATVDAVKEGTVIYAGKKADLGKTVVIQHADGTETWYGNLQSISINLYDFVETGAEVGKVVDVKEKAKGQFYFAIKQGDQFIDPIQVVSFD